MNAECVSVYVKVHPLLPLTYLRLLCQTSRDHREHLMFLCVASDSSKSQMTEKRRGNKSMKHEAEASLEVTVIHMHTSPTKRGMSAAAF